jgi:hypothetical protein
MIYPGTTGPSTFSEPEVKSLRNMIEHYSTGRGRVSVIHVRCCSGVVSPPQPYTNDERTKVNVINSAGNPLRNLESSGDDEDGVETGDGDGVGISSGVKPRANLDQLMKALSKVLKSADGTDYAVKPHDDHRGHSGQMVSACNTSNASVRQTESKLDLEGEWNLQNITKMEKENREGELGERCGENFELR